MIFPFFNIIFSLTNCCERLGQAAQMLANLRDLCAVYSEQEGLFIPSSIKGKLIAGDIDRDLNT